jgi:hypothetical protein
MAILTAARGLITQSSELTRPDGALVIADNINIDFDNTIQQRRGFRDYNAVDLTSSVKQLFTYKNTLLAYYGSVLAYDVSNSGAFNTFNGSYSELISGLRLKGLETNGNFYFTSSEGIKKISATSTSDIPNAIITNAGGVKASDLSGNLIPDSSGFLPAQSKVAYRLVFGTKDASSNLILGAPSARVILTNQTRANHINELFNVTFLNASNISDGDYWTFSDEMGGFFVWYNITGNATQPVTAQTIDKTGIEVNLKDVTISNNVVANYTAMTLQQVSSIQVQVSGSEVEVKLLNPGDATDADQGTLNATDVTITKINDGAITQGLPAIAELNFSLPESVTTAHFYQLYRTGIVTTSAGITLNDIDPGDEQQFVFENSITAADIAAGEITVTDNTPEVFRQSGAYLNTNAITGEGIAQANNPPPIAQDIALFRDSTFYANTKDFHRFTLNVLSVDDFVSGTTKLSIGQRNKYVEYTFVGVAEVTDITVAAKSDTIPDSYIEINSASNERKYYLWFDTDPLIANKIGIKIPLDLYDDTIEGSKQALIDSLLMIPDFAVEDFSADTVRITCTDSGEVSEPVLSDPAPGWTVTVVTEGDGEDVIAKEVLLSQSPSIGIAIDLTARSLVKVINRDPDSPVTAEYLSSNEDLPGKILLEAKSLEDNTFFVSISDSSLSEEFNPNLSETIQLTDITSSGNIFTTANPHGLIPGNKVYVNDNTGMEFAGDYEILTAPSSTTFTLKNVSVGIDQLSIFGVVINGDAISDNNAAPNRVAFSKPSQPEAVPLANFLPVGSKDKEILRILALRDNLFVLKEDGIFIITGSSASDFSVRLLDNSAVLIAPDTAVVLNNLIYALTSQGVVSISESGVSIVSRQIEDQIKKVTTSNFNYRYTAFGVGYESDRAYFLWLPELKTDTYATQCYRYNSITNTWTRWTVKGNCGIVNQLGDDKLYVGLADRPIVAQERKNLERQDHADRDFTRSIGADAFKDTTVIISSVAGVEKGDVIVQAQYVSVPKFNRLLSKLDRDSGPAFSDYRASLQVGVGASMANALLSLVSKLNEDENLAADFTVPSGSNNIEDLKADYNRLIVELNRPFSGTSVKSYKPVVDRLVYEVIITDVPKSGSNRVSINFSTWFIQGDVQIYKAIKTKVRWAPQHFGKPEEFKQIVDGTITFDQNTISSGTIAYASDRSADFVPIDFKMSGPGFWISYPWLDSVFGGGGNDRPMRTIVPQNKSRCRYLTVQFEHANAREQYKVVGISLEPRTVSTRAYR